jgi:hypothetical protein
MLITLVKEVNRSVSDFLFLGDRQVSLPISLTVKPNKGEAIRNLETGKLISVEPAQVLKTKTLKIGREKISFIVPQIRFDNANLAGEGRVLEIELELPNGRVKIEAVGEYYERFGRRTSLAEYVIEAKIVYLNPPAEEIYRNYLRSGRKAEKADAKSLAFGINER